MERDDPHIIIGKMNDISTHTLTWSVTQQVQAFLRRQIYFNSHAHVERDAEFVNKYFHKGISTHTLTWSVTQMLLTSTQNSTISTHTLTWSVTMNAVFPPFAKHTFQLTRSRGA